MSTEANIQNLKDWFTFIVAVIVCVAGVIFWVQSSNNPRFEKIEKDWIALQNFLFGLDCCSNIFVTRIASFGRGMGRLVFGRGMGRIVSAVC